MLLLFFAFYIFLPFLLLLKQFKCAQEFSGLEFWAKNYIIEAFFLNCSSVAVRLLQPHVTTEETFNFNFYKNSP